MGSYALNFSTKKEPFKTYDSNNRNIKNLQLFFCK